jgi:hypothetical protein
VSTGFVVDALGGKSKQIDVVVYRTDYAPVFEIGRVKHFLVESVVAVLEVKAAIDSQADLTRALENIASVKALDRTNRGRNELVAERILTPMAADREDHYSQVFGAIVTEKSLVENFSKDLLAWLNAHPRRQWPNICVDVRRLVAFYQFPPEGDEPPGPKVGGEAMRAEQLVISEPAPTNLAPLVLLGYELINWFRVIPTIEFAPSDYLPIRSQRYRSWQLPAIEPDVSQPPDP